MTEKITIKSKDPEKKWLDTTIDKEYETAAYNILWDHIWRLKHGYEWAATNGKNKAERTEAAAKANILGNIEKTMRRLEKDYNI